MTDDPRFVHLGARVDRLESDVLDIKSGVQKLLDRPQNPGLTQVLGTLATTLVVIGFIFTFAKYNMSEAVQPANDIAKLNARQIEETNDKLVRTLIAVAVLEERANWIRASGGWAPKVEGLTGR